MKILITGKNGQVGHALCQQLQKEKDIELFATDRRQLDITDQQAVQDNISRFSPDIIINCAAYTAVDRAEEHEKTAFTINCDAPGYLADAAKKVGTKLIHFSTDYVFDGAANIPYTEDMAPHPQSVYGRSKLAGEQAVAEHLQEHIIIRTAWVFGEHGNNFVKTMLRLANTRKDLSIVADQYGDPTYTADIAQTTLNIAKQIHTDPSDRYGLYHYSETPHTNWFEFAKRIFTEAERQNVLQQTPKLHAITTAEYPTAAKRPANSRLNCDKIKSTFNVPGTDWHNGLRSLENYLD